jgi:cyclin-dependent kinase-like
MQNKYEILSVIGEGSYGIVYKCRNRESNEIVAIKKFKDNTDISGNKSLMRELKSLKIFNHKNIINFRESFKKKGSYFFVFEYIEKNLLEFLTEYSDGIEPNLIKHIMFQICSGIRQIHKHNLAHRDIKPENILVDRTHKVKICDFGFTRLIEKNSNEYLTEYVATRWYRAPELLIGDKNYGLEIDYWSVGCIMGELIDGNPIFPGENDMEQIYMIYKICGKDSFSYEQIQIIEKKHNLAAAKVEKTKYINPLNNSEISIEINLDKRYSGKISREALSFLKRLLDPNPRTRIKSDEIFDHPYLLNYYNIYGGNNELYLNNFDNNNNFIKKGQNNGFSYSILKGNCKKEMNSTKKMESINSNGFYPNIKNNTINKDNNNFNKTNGINNNNKNDPNTRNPNNSNANNNTNNKLTTNKNFVPIIENFFEQMDSNSYEDLGNLNIIEQQKNLAAFAIGKVNENIIGGVNNKNIMNVTDQSNININNNNFNYEAFQKESKGISLEKPKIEALDPIEKNTNNDFYGSEYTTNIKLNNYGMEGVKPPNKEERNNYNYYNNIKLYNEDLFEKTGKIKASINPYESIYKITSQIKKENDKKVKKEKDRDKEKEKDRDKDKDKDKSNPSSTYSGITNKTSNNNNNNYATKSNFNNNGNLNVGNSVSLISNQEKNKENNNLNTINILSANHNDFSPISENFNKNLSTNFNKNEKHSNNQFKISMNFDKNKIFLSPQKNDVTSSLFFNNGNINNNFPNKDLNKINNGNFNYGGLMNFNLNNDKGFKYNSNNINSTIHNNGYSERNQVSNDDYNGKSLEFKMKQNNFNKSNVDNKFTTNKNFSPDLVRNGNITNLNSNQSINMSNITSISKFGQNNQTNIGINNNNTKSNKFPINNLNSLNSGNNGSNEFGVSTSISFNKNANIKINTNRDSNNQINDFLKNILHTNNFNLGLSSVKNSDIDHKRFNPLNSQNHLFMGAEENKKSSSLQKLQLPIIAKKEIGNKVK